MLPPAPNTQNPEQIARDIINSQIRACNEDIQNKDGYYPSEERETAGTYFRPFFWLKIPLRHKLAALTEAASAFADTRDLLAVQTLSLDPNPCCHSREYLLFKSSISN